MTSHLDRVTQAGILPQVNLIIHKKIQQILSVHKSMAQHNGSSHEAVAE
jgi:hypothetical protein